MILVKSRLAMTAMQPCSAHLYLTAQWEVLPIISLFRNFIKISKNNTIFNGFALE